MCWLLLKDLQILRRSPLLVALLVLYPIVVALLIGLALSRGPEKPRVAIVTPGRGAYLPRELRDIEPVAVPSRAAALRKVRDGEVLAAVVLPPDIASKLAMGLQQPTVEVLYNGEDPIKQRYVESVVTSQLADADAVLSHRFERATIGYIRLLVEGGDLHVLGRAIPILGLRNARTAVRGAMASLPPRSPQRAALRQAERFATLAIDNLGSSSDALRSVAAPVRVKQTVLGAHRTPLDAFAVAIAVTVSLMFLTLLLACGLLALEREEHAFGRLVRGLVSRLELLAEKIGLAALCGTAVTLVMLLTLGGLFVDLDWARFPLWLLALTLGALAFGALGVAIGGVAREVRAASLLAFGLSLPIAFLALVPSGAVSAGLYDVVRVVSALFPFKPALQALDAALNDTRPGIAGPLAHLLALAAAYTVLARLSLRRFA